MAVKETLSQDRRVAYPDADGKPTADNTLQFEWISKLKGALEYLFLDQPQVFVAGDLIWYAQEGKPEISKAPDVMVVFGRPKGYRGSYRQWEEAGIAPQVVIEVLSPSNKTSEMVRKQFFYDRYGVEEYYLLDPETRELFVWMRKGEQLALNFVDVPGQRWTSPRLGLTFAVEEKSLEAFFPNGDPVLPYQEMQRRLEARALAAEQRLAALEAELKKLKGESE